MRAFGAYPPPGQPSYRRCTAVSFNALFPPGCKAIPSCHSPSTIVDKLLALSWPKKLTVNIP